MNGLPESQMSENVLTRNAGPLIGTKKRCPKCKTIKHLDYFGNNKSRKYGKRSYCNVCERILNKKMYLDNIESRREKSLSRYHANQNKCKEQNRLWIENNPEKAKQSTLKWRENNPDKVREYAQRANRRYYKKNKERCKGWAANNPEKRKEVCKKYRTCKMKSPKFRLANSVSSLMRICLKKKKNGRRWESLVGYSIDDLMNHLQKQFEPGMEFKNYGKWHIDHKIPISVFNFEKPEDDDFKKCWALPNLQPLWAKDNILKSNKIDKPFQPSLIFG